MKPVEKNKITSNLFRKNIRTDDFKLLFERIFEVDIEELLVGGEYDEIDEFPIELDSKGIMIGFSAETVKAKLQIEYIDLDVINHHHNFLRLLKEIPRNSNFLKLELIQENLTPCDNLRIYYSIYNLKKIDRVIFQHEDLRYELSINDDSVVSRIRVCIAEIESSINMRTYYLFD
ncbi:hypothetical protein GCM10027051_29480 [Niabella terrae]